MKPTFLMPALLAIVLSSHAGNETPIPMTPTPGVAQTNVAAATAPSQVAPVKAKAAPKQVKPAQTPAFMPVETSLDMSPAGPQSLSLDDCIGMALEKNLDIRIERYNPQLRVFDVSVARAVYDPVFAASAEHNYEKSGSRLLSGGFSIPGSKSEDDSFTSSLGGALPWGMSYNFQGRTTDTYGNQSTNLFENTSGSVSVTLTQPLLRDSWIDGNRLTIKVAKNRVKWSEQGLRAQLISTVSSVEQTYFELIFAQENVKVYQQALQLAEQLFKENKKRVEVGVLAPLDEKQAEAQVATSRANLIAAESYLATQQNTLKQLITDDYASWGRAKLQSAESLASVKQLFDVRDSWSRGLNDRPDLLQSRIDLEKAGIDLKYYRNQLLPRLDLSGTYGHSGSQTEFSGALEDIRRGNEPFYGYGVQFSIPLGNAAARKRYQSGKLTVEQAVLSVKKLEQQVMFDIDEAINQAESSYESVLATREARNFAEAALDAEQKKLENGKSTSFNVLSLQTDLTDARSKEIRALANYNKALTALASAEGSTLDRRRIDVLMK